MRMRTTRTARGMCGSVAGLTAALALVVMGAPEAMAGGPTSVLVVSPESGQSTALYVSDKAYGELERSLGETAVIGEGRRERPPGLNMGDGSRQINVTWMVHDVRPWRVDRAYPVAAGSEVGKNGKEDKDGKDGKDTAVVWIHTTTDMESMTGTWHKAKDPARLTALFKKLGVMGAPTDKGNQAIAPGADPAPPPKSALDTDTGSGSGSGSEAKPEQAAAASGPSDGAPGDGGAGWWWAIPGAAAGAVGALLLRGPLVERRRLLALLRGRRPHEDGPRQELRDV